MDLAAEYTAMRKGLMSYCKLTEEDLSDPDDEKEFHEIFDAAVSYMEDAGVVMPKAGTPRRAKYNRCIKAMVLEDWDLRGSSSGSSEVKENPAFRRKVNQLKMTEPVSDSDTGIGE